MTNKFKLDGNKILHHLDRLAAWKNGDYISPIYLSFGPTQRCNNRCIFCAYEREEQEKNDFPYSRFTSLIDELATAGLRSLFFSGDGEPLLHSRASDMITYAKTAGIDVALNTNGSLISISNASALVKNLSWIRISFNGGTEDSYSKIHRCSKSQFDQVLSNIELLVNEKRKANSNITIGVQSLILEDNICELPIIAAKLKRIGASYFSIKPYLDHPDSPYNNNWRPTTKQVESVKSLENLNTENFTFSYRATNDHNQSKRIYSKCLSFPFMAELDALGNLYSCGPQIGKEDFLFGNVLSNSFETIWREKDSVIKKIHTTHDVNKCMSCCRNDSLNTTLWEINNPPEHVNYI